MSKVILGHLGADAGEAALEKAESGAAARFLRRRHERGNGISIEHEKLWARVEAVLDSKAEPNSQEREMPVHELIRRSKRALNEKDWISVLRVNNNLYEHPDNKLGIDGSAFMRGAEVPRTRAILNGRLRDCLSSHQERGRRGNGRSRKIA